MRLLLPSLTLARSMLKTSSSTPLAIFPHLSSFLHFEDFGVANASRLLQKYRSKQSCFNDDMQGTAAVVLAALISAVNVTKTELKDARIVVFGAGTAGMGIADGIRTALMIEGGQTSEQVRQQFWFVPSLLPFSPYSVLTHTFC